MENSKLVSCKAVAARLGVSVVTVIRWGKAGKFKMFRLGDNLYRVDAESVEAFIKPVKLSTAGANAAGIQKQAGDVELSTGGVDALDSVVI